MRLKDFYEEHLVLNGKVIKINNRVINKNKGAIYRFVRQPATKEYHRPVIPMHSTVQELKPSQTHYS